MADTSGTDNNNLSEKGSALIKKTLLHADEQSFKEGVSEDMMSVLTGIVGDVITGIFDTYPENFETLSSEQLQQFKNSFYESIGVGYKIYWTERKYLKDEHDFVQFNGDEFKNYLYTEYQAYFVNDSKNPEPSTPPYIFEAINYFGTFMFKGGFVKGNNIDILKELLTVDDNFLEKVNIPTLLQSFIWTGYILSKSQDKYRILMQHK